jgi:hypothetical protein
MATYSKYNIVYRLQKWMDSVAGQTFLNYAYSWGAAVVILGTLFKLTHLPGANFFLFLGMGTEVFVFFISAFDRPFDKTADGLDLQRNEELHHNDDEEEISIVDNEQIESARRRTTEMEKVYVPGVKRTMAATVMAQTQYQMEQAQQLSERLPDNEETAELKKTLGAIHEIYKLQLTKASSQMTTVEEIDKQLRIMSANLENLNKIYARMIEAVRQ